MAQDIVDRIEKAARVCGQCGKALLPDGPSPDFCNEACQRWWHAERVDERAA
jgi:hypothetical protein